MLLNIVTDEKLLTSQIVKIVLLCITCGGIIVNLIKFIRIKETKRRVIIFLTLLGLCFATYYILNEYFMERSLLHNPKYVTGTTLGYCSVTGLGEGIEFEYEVNGKKIRNCNTYYPLFKDSINVPNGKYIVRYSENDITDGRMDFKKPVSGAK